MDIPVGGRLAAFRHFSMITRILIKHGMGELAHRLFTMRSGRRNTKKFNWPDPGRIRTVFEELGPTFIKLGQLMSTRADMLPPDYITELSKLQDHVPPVPFDRILPVIEAGLGQPWQAVFKDIEQEAMAAASVAQVHIAHLKNGEQVALKIVRPGIEKRIRKDIRLMRYIARKLETRSETARALGAETLVEEFERVILRELDMKAEAGHIDRFAKSFSDNHEIYIPKVYRPYTSQSVLVMEHIPGIKMDQVADIKRNGLDPEQVALIGLRCFSSQLMEAGFFHADPHPGNVIVMYDGRVSLIDFGIVGYLDENTMLQIANVFMGFSEHDYEMVIDAFFSAGLIDDQTRSMEAFQIDLIELCEPFYGRSLKSITVREVYDQAMRLLYKYHLRLPRNLLLLFKTLVQTEALGKILGSDASLLEVTRPYAKRLVMRGQETQKILKSIGRDIKTAGGYLRSMPKLTHEVFKRLAGGKGRMEVIHSGLEQTATRFETGLNRLTIGLVVAASIIAASLVLNSAQTVMTFEIDFLGHHQVAITQLLGSWGTALPPSWAFG